MASGTGNLWLLTTHSSTAQRFEQFIANRKCFYYYIPDECVLDGGQKAMVGGNDAESILSCFFDSSWTSVAECTMVSMFREVDVTLM